MTMMVAQCFAKNCIHLHESSVLQDEHKLRPCMGCRSQWIHTGCGLCSDCQTGNMTTPMEAMKNSFCSQVDKKIHKRSSDRSPLSIKQSQIAKRLEDSVGFKEGKENGACLNGKRHRKPTTPPALTPIIKPSEIPVLSSSTAKNSDTNNKKRKLSLGNKGEPIAKKARKVSTAPGGTPKKYASADEPHSGKRKARIKKVVEVKMAEDGTHNPDRLLFHVRNNQPIDKGEPEAEESYEWLDQLTQKQTDDFVDLNEGEKAFFKLWNTHLHRNPCFGDRMMVQILDMFITQNSVRIFRANLYKNFMLHLSNFHQFGIISSIEMMDMIDKYQSIIKDMAANPTAYPETPAKVPIENPYYKPKPVPLEESLTLHLSEDEDDLDMKTPSVASPKPSISSIGSNKKQSFWLKKSFRNPVMKSQDDPDEEMWGPRKKVQVSFANDIVVEEITDLHGKSNGNFAFHDVADLIKFISPRQRRCKSWNVEYVYYAAILDFRPIKETTLSKKCLKNIGLRG